MGLTVRAGYLSQTVAELPGSVTALSAVEDVRPVVELDRGRELTARQVAERLGLTGERLFTRVADLSGGERRRLQLVRLLMAGPNVLLLDEPTNDVDLETLTALEDLLDGWAGTLVVVSHDRYVLERVCDRMVGLLGDGTVRDLPGGVDEYLRLRGALQAAVPASTGSAPETTTSDAATVRAARKDLARIERRLGRLAEQREDLEREMVLRATDHIAVAELDARVRAVLGEVASLEDEWLAVSEVVDG